MATWLTASVIRATLGDDADSLYSLPEDAATQARDIAAAEAEVRASLSRYDWPITDSDVTALLSGIASDIFAAIAWRRGAGDEIPTKIKDAADHARRMLDRIRKAELVLDGATLATTTGDQSALVISGNDPEFDRDNMGEF